MNDVDVTTNVQQMALAIVRIPKTASSKLLQVLVPMIHRECVADAYCDDRRSQLWSNNSTGLVDWGQCLAQQRAELKALQSCHQAWVVNNHLRHWTLASQALRGGVLPVFITFLREPIARTISEFGNAAARQQGLWDYSGASNLSSFDAWLHCGRCIAGWSNRQTRMLGARNALTDGADGRSMRRAQLVVRRMLFVGLVEQFSASTSLLGRVLKLELSSLEDTPQRVNHRDGAGSAVSASSQRLLARRNALDAALFGGAVDCLDNRRLVQPGRPALR